LQFEGDEDYTSSEEEEEMEEGNGGGGGGARSADDDDEYIDEDEEEELGGPYGMMNRGDLELASVKRVDRELEWDDTSLEVKLKQSQLNEVKRSGCNKSTSFIDSNQFV
jgi:hypothetical protein